jgi:UDPglucose--hexose-1-phosphate uridylyltransferase
MTTDKVHRRRNPLTGEWVLVSPHRTLRPWQGQQESAQHSPRAVYDPSCYLCPGNARAGGHVNPAYDGVFVFDNDFSALERTRDFVDLNPRSEDSGDLLVSQPESGVCRVVCFSPDHSLALPGMSSTALAQVIHCWQAQYVELGALPDINSVQIFENRGAMMGSSNPHPHGQVWATHSLPNELEKESRLQRRYADDHSECLLCRYAQVEMEQTSRVVYRNEGFLAVVPYWAVWPFETLVLPLRHGGSLAQLSAAECLEFADVLGRLTRAYDALFDSPFPYSMGLHQQPTDGQQHDAWHWHAHFYPPLLRSASIRKFMVGFELLAGPQRDITPELAAQQIRSTIS